MRGLRLGLGLGKGKAGEPPAFTVALTNLTSGEARNGATIGVNIPELVGGETITYQWTDNGSNISGATSSTFTVNIGTNMTDGQTLRCVATIDGTPYTSNGAPARYAPGTAPAIADGQAFNTSTAVNIDAAASGTGLTWSYVATGLPSGVSINSGTGAITGTPSGASSGTATVTATDQYGRTVQDTFTYTVTLSVNPTVTSDSYTAGGSGTAANFNVQGGYTGSDPIDIYVAAGNSMTVTEAQLIAKSGGTGVDAFFSVAGITVTGGSFNFNEAITVSDLTIVTNIAGVEGADQFKYVIVERNNGGSTGVLTAGDTITGLDATVPAWGTDITAASSVDGLSIVLTSSEALYLSNDFADWTVAGAASTPTVNAISGSGTTSITLTLSAAIANGETITLDFADTDTNLRDARGNLIGDIGTPISVTNNVPSSGNTYTDNFNGRSEQLEASAQWAKQAGDAFTLATVGSDVLTLTTGAANRSGAWSFEETLTNDQRAEIEYVSTSGSGNRFPRLTTRWSGTGTGNGYTATLIIHSNTIELVRFNSGSGTVLDGPYSHTFTAGDKFAMESIGTTHKVYIDTGSGWTEILSATDATHGSGKAALTYFIATSGNSVVFDNFVGKDA